MAEFDLVVRGGLATAADRFGADVGVSDGRIAPLAAGLPPGRREVGVGAAPSSGSEAR